MKFNYIFICNTHDGRTENILEWVQRSQNKLVLSLSLSSLLLSHLLTPTRNCPFIFTFSCCHPPSSTRYSMLLLHITFKISTVCYIQYTSKSNHIKSWERKNMYIKIYWIGQKKFRVYALGLAQEDFVVQLSISTLSVV